MSDSELLKTLFAFKMSRIKKYFSLITLYTWKEPFHLLYLLSNVTMKTTA